MTKFETVAIAFAGQFTRRTRANGESFYTLKDGAPEWMTDALYSAHGGMLPDDWKYRAAARITQALADGSDPDDFAEALDSEVDVYTARLTAWLATNLARVDYCDRAREEYGVAETLEKQLQAGQYLELSEIAADLIEAINDQVAADGGDDSESDDESGADAADCHQSDDFLK